MSSLRQHFQRIKEIVDWSWTLALLCLIGYITLGQLVQLYWAMLFLGGLAGSFGIFYEFSCQKLAELDSLNAYELQKANVSAYSAKIMLREFANRNPRITNQFYDFVQANEQVNNVIEKSHTSFHNKVYEQRQKTQQKPSQPPRKRQTSPRPSSPQRVEYLKPTPPKPSQLRRESKLRLNAIEYSRISNQSDYEFVRGYMKKNGTPVKGYYRRKRNR
ncbi:MAG: hypothetical protein EA343_19685 [Nodularia sp. (in: Bacteria)]|nr:MAG: hypothetical protein EA343_19685 [Nodularia sp. (in: cyanobacteria)]